MKAVPEVSSRADPGTRFDRTRVVLCTYPSLYSSTVLRPLLEAPDIEVVGVICSTRLFKKRYGLLRSALAFARQSGWAYLAYHMVVTDVFHMVQPVAACKGVRRLCAERGIPLHDTADINTAEAAQFLRVVAPDLILSAYFNQFIHKQVRELPRYGSINIHPSLLPRFRGADPVFHALLDEAPDLGVSVHWMDDAFDTGNLLHQTAVPADGYDSLLACYDALFERGAQLAIEAIGEIRRGAPGVPQSPGGDYVGWPTRYNMTAFRERGRQLVTLRGFVAALSKRAGMPTS